MPTGTTTATPSPTSAAALDAQPRLRQRPITAARQVYQRHGRCRTGARRFRAPRSASGRDYAEAYNERGRLYHSRATIAQAIADYSAAIRHRSAIMRRRTTTAARRMTAGAITTRRWRISTKPSGSRRLLPRLTTIAAMPRTARAITTGRSPIMPRRSSSRPISPAPIPTAASAVSPTAISRTPPTISPSLLAHRTQRLRRDVAVSGARARRHGHSRSELERRAQVLRRQGLAGAHRAILLSAAWTRRPSARSPAATRARAARAGLRDRFLPGRIARCCRTTARARRRSSRRVLECMLALLLCLPRGRGRAGPAERAAAAARRHRAAFPDRPTSTGAANAPYISRG